VLEGVVREADTGDPLPGAHVFVAQSLTGTTTDADGRYRLTGISPGAALLYVSMMGYENQRRALRLRAGTTRSVSFRLPKEVLQAEEVVVEAERDEEWYDRLGKFRRLFVGESAFAEHCRIVNPTVLRFDSKWWGKFTADAVRPLVVENRALGYRVTYHLEEFEASGGVIRWDGEPFFEALEPADSSEAARWAANRARAYRGSLRHFLRALRHDRVREAGFRMYRIPRAGVYRHVGRADRFPARRRQILSPGPDSTALLSFPGRIEVVYRREGEQPAFLDWARDRRRRAPRSHQTSQIELNDPPVHVDPHGEIVEPYGATVFGYFSFELRLAQLLPVEYAAPAEAAAKP
jgi:hypothetical protein